MDGAGPGLPLAHDHGDLPDPAPVHDSGDDRLRFRVVGGVFVGVDADESSVDGPEAAGHIVDADPCAQPDQHAQECRPAQPGSAP